MDNSAQIEMWNGPSGRRWVRHVEETDRAFGQFGQRALDVLGAKPGERVMDFGCGAGTLTLALAEAVGTRGAVLGVDPSAALVQHAAARGAHLEHLKFACQDAAEHKPNFPHDALYSCFGAMFFAKPVDAFASLRETLRPGGRLVFACWQAAALNRWCSAPLEVVLPLVAEPPPKPKPCSPGTFSLADASYMTSILTDAGYKHLELRDVRAPVPMGPGGVQAAVTSSLHIGPVASLTEKQTPDVQAKIKERLAELYSSVADGDNVSLDGAAWIVSARA